MIKNILLDASGDSACDARLRAAIELARENDAHLTCLQVTPVDTIFSGLVLAENAMSREDEDRVREDETRHRDSVAASLKEARIDWEWVHRDGAIDENFLENSALADLVVLSSGSGTDDAEDTAMALISALAVFGRTPLLCIPAVPVRAGWTEHALLAWNGSREAAHAVRQAMPMLAKARDVHIVAVGKDDSVHPAADAQTYLRRHGIRSEVHHRVEAGGSTADALLDMAATLEAGYIVAGAYGRSRFLESLLGGTTRALIANSSLPLLLGR